MVVRRSGESVAAFADAVAPGLLVAQAIGRVGNWWNQELFGEPTDVAWALEIDLEHRPPEYADSETFHPTFLYEGLWNLFAAGVLLLVDRFFRIRPPALFALYVSLYTRVPHVRGDAAHRHLARVRRPAAELLGRAGAVRARDRVLRLVAADPAVAASGGAAARVSEPAERGPAMAIPKKRVRSPR